jgi:hypothetical protein
MATLIGSWLRLELSMANAATVVTARVMCNKQSSTAKMGRNTGG